MPTTRKRGMPLAFALLFLFCGQVRAQQLPIGPDSLYLQFTKAYDELDAGKLSRLYAEQAELLNLYDGGPSNSLKGRAAILEYFTSFFEGVKQNGQKLQLTFKIADRQVKGEYVMDNGYYMLELLTPGKPTVPGFGKFSVVLERSGNGYLFKTDATTNAEIIDYENAVAGSIPQREALLHAELYDGMLGNYVLDNGELIVIGRSQVRLFAFMDSTGEYRGLNKVNANTWTAGDRVRSDDKVQTFHFSKEGLEIRDRDGNVQRAVRRSLYQAEKLIFTGGKGLKMGATLFRPKDPAGKAIVMVHGSGPQDRNGYASYIRLMADVFARNGITVLTYDKRGVGASEGNSETAGFADLAEDALAGVAYLRQRKDLGLNQIGLGGSSQAGWVIAKAIEQHGHEVDFAVTLGAAGSGISVIEQNLYNTGISMRCTGGFSEKQVSQALLQQRYFFDFLRDHSKAGKLDGFTKALRKDSLIRDWLFPLSTEVDLHQRDQWFTALEIGFDPLPVWKGYDKQVLMTFSAFDDATPSSMVKAKVDGLKKKNINTVMFEKAQHLGLQASSVCMGNLTQVSTFHPLFFKVVVDWLRHLQ